MKLGEVLTSFNNYNSANFSGKKRTMKNSGVFFLTIREKTVNQISYSLSLSNLESKGIYFKCFQSAKMIKFSVKHRDMTSPVAFRGL